MNQLNNTFPALFKDAHNSLTFRGRIHLRCVIPGANQLFSPTCVTLVHDQTDDDIIWGSTLCMWKCFPEITRIHSNFYRELRVLRNPIYALTGVFTQIILGIKRSFLELKSPVCRDASCRSMQKWKRIDCWKPEPANVRTGAQLLDRIW